MCCLFRRPQGTCATARGHVYRALRRQSLQDKGARVGQQSGSRRAHQSSVRPRWGIYGAPRGLPEQQRLPLRPFTTRGDPPPSEADDNPDKAHQGVRRESTMPQEISYRRSGKKHAHPRNPERREGREGAGEVERARVPERVERGQAVETTSCSKWEHRVTMRSATFSSASSTCSDRIVVERSYNSMRGRRCTTSPTLSMRSSSSSVLSSQIPPSIPSSGRLESIAT